MTVFKCLFSSRQNIKGYFSSFRNLFTVLYIRPSHVPFISSVYEITAKSEILPTYGGFVFSDAQNRYLNTYVSSVSASGDSANANSGEKDNLKESQDGGHDRKFVRGGPVSWSSFFLLVTTGVGLAYYYDKEKQRRIEEIKKDSISVKEGPSAGNAAIGGPFTLINHEGKPVTEKDFMGRWTLMYFGFTHCPDICPEELQKLASAVDLIKKKARLEVVPLFISVDPERDTVDHVREYVKEFHPNLIGLTGSIEEIQKVARSYRVYYMKTEEEDSDYLVDHSTVMYLMGPDMRFVRYFGKNNDADALADGVIKEIKK